MSTQWPLISERHRHVRVKWRQLSVRLFRYQQCHCSESLWTLLAISIQKHQHPALMFGSGLPNFTHFGDAAEAHRRHHGLSMSMPLTQAPDPSAPDEEAEYAPLRPQSSAPARSPRSLLWMGPRPAPDPSAPDQAPEVTTTAPEPEATPHQPSHGVKKNRPFVPINHREENPYSKRAKLDHDVLANGKSFGMRP